MSNLTPVGNGDTPVTVYVDFDAELTSEGRYGLFFDFQHGQTGVARNGIELHPVLAFDEGRAHAAVDGLDAVGAGDDGAQLELGDLRQVIGHPGDAQQQVLQRGEGIALYEQLLPMERGGQARETWWNYSFTPIRHADHSIGGVFNQGNEITGKLTERDAYSDQIPAGTGLSAEAYPV